MSEQTAGERLKAARERKRLSQTEAAQAVGASGAGTWSDWERGVKAPSGRFIAGIRKLFGSKVADAWGAE